MDIRIIGSTNNIRTKKEALEFAANCGRVCYSEDGFHEAMPGASEKLINRLLNSGHHSPFDQVSFNFEFNDIPKFGAMIFNNQRPYTTSEKSARYKIMELEGEQKELYEKWKGIFRRKIDEKYASLEDPTKVEKLAQENARYLTSAFTPTHMVHEISFRQLSYFVHWFEDFMANAENTDFNVRVKQFMEQFNLIINNDYDLFEERLDPKIKKRRLSIFADRDFFPVEFGENYSTVYKGTFSQLAQTHRHRTIDYEIVGLDEDLSLMQPFVPPIIRDDDGLVSDWIRDFGKVSYDFPQGMLITIHETGNYRDFISKATERLCEHAQWEIMNQTRSTLMSYIEATTNPYIRNELLKYSKGPKCTFPEGWCSEPGPFGRDLALERLV